MKSSEIADIEIKQESTTEQIINNPEVTGCNSSKPDDNAENVEDDTIK